jgi:hypothetical protein
MRNLNFESGKRFIPHSEFRIPHYWGSCFLDLPFSP